MSALRIEPPYGAIWNMLQNGEVVPFLGAGASSLGRPEGSRWDPNQPKFLPRGSELAEQLAREVSFPSNQESDLHDLAKVCSYYVHTTSRPQLRERLRTLLYHDFMPAALHRFLAAIPKNLIVVTTNYDTLVETAFQQAGKPFDTVVYPTDRVDYPNAILLKRHSEVEFKTEDPRQLDLDLTQSSVIFKVHGNLHESQKEHDSFVISEEDYVEFLAKMVHQAAVPQWFVREFSTRTFLFLGYSLRDWNLRVVLNSIRDAGGRASQTRSWAIQYQPSLLEQSLWRNRDVLIYDQPLEDFVERMWQVSGLPRS